MNLIAYESCLPTPSLRSGTTDLVKAFLAGRTPSTLATYGQALESFRAFLDVTTLDYAADALLSHGNGHANRLALTYKASLIARNASAATMNLRLAALRSLVKLASTLGIVSWRLEVESVKAEAYRDTRGPGDAAYARMLQSVSNRRDAKGTRDNAILRLLHDLALRRGELVAMDVTDVDFAAARVQVLRKGRNEKTTLTCPASTLQAIQDWLQLRGDTPGPLFLNLDRAKKGQRLTGSGLYRIVRDLGSKVGAKTRPHGLRHTAITVACIKASANRIPLEEVLDYSGHSSVKTLLIYRDRERNSQGRIANLVAGDIGD